jgi:DNA-binding HxlR family transcriptional regulator
MKSEKKLVFRTWDQMCLDKLKEIGKSGLTKWAKAMGYTNQTCMTKTANILMKKGLVRDIPNPGGKVRRYYEVV